jgi:hypothetical protein
LEKKASDRGDNRNKMGKYGRAEWTRGTEMEANSKKWKEREKPLRMGKSDGRLALLKV